VIVEDGIVVGGWRSSRKAGRLEITLNLPRGERERLSAKIEAEVADHRALRGYGGHDPLARVPSRARSTGGVTTTQGDRLKR